MANRVYLRVPLKNILNVTRVVTNYSYDLSADFVFEGERHDFWELIYVVRGEILFCSGSEERALRQGEIAFHAPNAFHSIRCDGTHGASVWILSFDCRSSAMKFFSGKSVRLPSDLHPLMGRLMEECERCFYTSKRPLLVREDAPMGAQQLIRLYLEELLLLLMRSQGEGNESLALFSSRDGLEDSLVSDLYEYLRSHVCDRVTLEELSRHFHFGKSHLCDVFKRATGRGIIDALLDLKIKEAKRLLREEPLTVSEISERLGFESPAYFSRCFRKRVGISPKAYRERPVDPRRVRTR